MRLPSLAATLLLATLFAPTLTRAADTPHYHLDVGDVLTYKVAWNSHRKSGSATDLTGQLRIIVTSKAPDGWNLAIFATEKSTETPVPTTAPASQPASSESSTFGLGHLHANGGIDSVGDYDPDRASLLFIPLPSSSVIPQTYSADSEQNMTLSINSTPLDHRQIAFHVDRASPSLTAYQTTFESRTTFDLSRGLPIQCQTTQIRNDTGPFEAHADIQLQSVSQNSAADTQQLDHDINTLTQSLAAYHKLFPLTGDKAAMTLALKQADDNFAAAASTIKTPAIQEEAKSTLSSMKDDVDWQVDKALLKAALLNQPAPDFKFPQIDGPTISLASLRGKVVLLDFWYKHCPYCMIASPVISQLADQYKKQPLVILGMNTDADEKDARSAITLMHINYPTLKTTFDFARTLGVRIYPTFILIDQQGIIRLFYEGEEPTLLTDLQKQINTLLPQVLPTPPSAPSPAPQ